MRASFPSIQSFFDREVAASVPQRLATSVPTPFPTSDFAFHDPASSRVLFTLAEVDDEARLASRGNFTGMLNVLVLKTHLKDCRLQGTTCVTEWYVKHPHPAVASPHCWATDTS